MRKITCFLLHRGNKKVACPLAKKRRISSENGKDVGNRRLRTSRRIHAVFGRRSFRKPSTAHREIPSAYNVENPFTDNENGSITPPHEEFGF